MGLGSWFKRNVGTILNPVSAISGSKTVQNLIDPIGATMGQAYEGYKSGGLEGAARGFGQAPFTRIAMPGTALLARDPYKFLDFSAYGVGDFISPQFTKKGAGWSELLKGIGSPSKGGNPVYDIIGPIMAAYWGGNLLSPFLTGGGEASTTPAVESLIPETTQGGMSSIVGTPGAGSFSRNVPAGLSSSNLTKGISNIIGVPGTGSFSRNLPTEFGSSVLKKRMPSVIGVPGTGSFSRNVPTGWSNLTPSSILNLPAKDIISKYGPILGSNILGSYTQSGMLEDLANAQNTSYQQYLNAINPPQNVLDTRFKQAKSQIMASAPIARRRISDELASRGIRGEGLASPITSLEKDINRQINNAYFDIYGNYNVPTIAPPVNYVPSTTQLAGKNIADIGTLLALNNILQ